MQMKWKKADGDKGNNEDRKEYQSLVPGRLRGPEIWKHCSS
jgi:hypothetical protein